MSLKPRQGQKQVRGDYQFVFHKNLTGQGGLTIRVCTHFPLHGDFLTTVCCQVDKESEEVSYPDIIADYHRHMGSCNHKSLCNLQGHSNYAYQGHHPTEVFSEWS